MAAAETVLDTFLSQGARLVEVVRVEGEESGVIWRCGCGQGSNWAFSTDVSLIDPVLLTASVARTHAALCTR